HEREGNRSEAVAQWRMYLHLGTRFGGAGKGFRGRKFSLGPDSAIGEILFLPNGDRVLERIDGEAAGIEGGAAVWRADGDQDAGFADLQAPQPMQHGDAMNGKLL